MNTITPNKHARFESRYPAEIVTPIKIMLRQFIGVDPMPSYRSMARLIEITYPVKISGTTVKRMLAKLKCFAHSAENPSSPLTPNDSSENKSLKSFDAAGSADKDGK